MTESEQETYELFRNRTERAARAQREADILAEQLRVKQAEVANLKAEAKVYAQELGFTT